MSANGRLRPDELASIGGGFLLRTDAARAFNVMNVEAQRRFGARVAVLSAYRTYAQQLWFWQLYRSGRGNLAAYPGTSNHGEGIAIDCANRRSRWIIDQIGARYGWAKRWSDAPSEWWHIRFVPQYVTADITPPALRPGAAGVRVSALQRRLRAIGFKSVPAPHHAGYGYYGEATATAVKRFQHAHHLHVDGIVGPTTIAALRAV